MKEVKDFIYLDIDKVSSLYSQLSGGIIQSFEISSASSEDNKNLRNYDFKFFKHEAGSSGTESQGIKEVRISHHEVYSELEQELFKNGYAAEIGVEISKEDIQSGNAVNIFENVLCVKAEGSIVLEDYDRITRIADNYEEIVDVINQSRKISLKESPEAKKLLEQIDTMKSSISSMKNGSEKIKRRNQVKEFESELNNLIETKAVGKVDNSIIEGLKTWVRVFLPDIFNIRLYPFSDLDNFHVMSNVKREFFLDNKTESVHYLFGSKPTVKVTMLGVITSIPPKEQSDFDPMKEFESKSMDEESRKHLNFENGFRGVFRGFDGLEELIRTCHYPRIMVHPIAIYRAVKPNKTLQRENY